MSWIEEEVAGADFGDQRLSKRFKQIVKRMWEAPSASLKSAMKGWAEVMAAYRFFSHAEVTPETLLAPHRQATLERVKAQARVVVIQDTTELDYSRKTKLEGRGPLNSEERQGFFAHHQLVITPERLPLGVWGSEVWARDEDQHGQSRERKNHPIEEKESFRWLKGYRDACELAEAAPKTQVIACADREGDIYEIFAEWQKRQEEGQRAADWLIRCNQNRRVVEGSPDASETMARKLWPQLGASPVLGTTRVVVKKKEEYKKQKGTRRKVQRSGRIATLEVKASCLTLDPPYRKSSPLAEVSIWVMSAIERDPPPGEEAIRWILLTSLPLNGFEAALEVLDLYLGRWEIENFHRVLKTGCRVEELQLKNDHRTKAALALYVIIAWRVLYVMKLGRECPDLPCDVIFEEDEWKALWVIVHGRDGLERKPKLGEFVRTVAEFGGFLGRKADGEPGAQAIWQGLTRVRDFTIAWLAYQHHQLLRL